MNKYLIGGITIGTAIEFPELISSDKPVDTTIAYGKIPEINGKLSLDRVFMKIYDSDEVVFTIPELANYYVKGTEEVIIEILNKDRKQDAEKYIITLAFGILSYKKGYYPLHGGGIIHNGKAILFTGKSGAGKSTTMVGLHKRGYESVGDDIANLFLKDGKVYVNPCFPRFKLWEDSMEMLAQHGSEAYKLRADLNKYLIPMKKFAKSAIEVDRIYLLQEDRISEDFQFKEIKGLEKVKKISFNNYKPFMVNAFDLKKAHFPLMTQMSKDLKLFEFHRQKDKAQFDKMLDTLITHFDSE